MNLKIINSHCLEYMRTMPKNSIDSIVTDPPYGLSFMGKKWDYDVPSVEIWRECLRVLKPGGHLLSFAGTRTQHRMAVNIEDAGFEIRDMIAWVYSSGFPKSLDVSKAIDKMAGAERKVIGVRSDGCGNTEASIHKSQGFATSRSAVFDISAPATDAAKQWYGWGTALKPALEPITLARKPLIGTVAENVQTYGTGAMNIDRTRIEITDGAKMARNNKLGENGWKNSSGGQNNAALHGEPSGRWPANLIHDGSEEVAGLFGSAARFFYCAKASKSDREEGNNHPTVKPTTLMRYLCRLVTPPNGTILDPFMGSGSTGKAAKFEGFDFIGIEREAEYCEIAKKRIESVCLKQLKN